MLFFWCVLYLHRLPRASPTPSSLGFSLGQAGFLATSWTSALVFEHAVCTIHLSPLPKLQPRVGGCLCGLASPYPPTGPLLCLQEEPDVREKHTQRISYLVCQ